MKEVYILLTDTGTTLNRTIKLVTHAPYNHASIALDKELNEVFSFGRKQPINPLYGGFVQEDFVKGTFSWYPETTCAIYKLEVNERIYNKMLRLIAAFKKNRKWYYYNFIGLFGVPINHPIEVPSSYFCSQFVAEILRRSGIKLFNKPSSLVSPNDFRSANKLDLVYEGKIYDYPELKLSYNPKKYNSFPFRKYVAQQIKAAFDGNSDEREYYFRDGFVKPKKILFERKIRDASSIIKK
ncbi:hypothetical protein [Cytobacillus sp. IB215316]|uniref:hypothetical protein n=1 Tax=Cytobacillus sp. IB215316 TaxID=3097354 RepID=UPI002A0C23DA|nr:hypothetical protein [Cytobacillus sp. IB215316]MDX8362584.1 hypothetical protein [Cytobacillus sp. IB215316]